MPKLKNLKIRGFRSIKEMTLELRPLNVLIGANGAGKSNLIAFFKLVLEDYSLGEIWEKNVIGGGPH